MITKKTAIEGSVPVIAGGQKPAYFHNVANRTGETVAVSSSGAFAGFVSYWNVPVFLSDSFSVEVPELLPKFLFYVLKNKQEEIHALKKGSGVPHVHASDFDRFRIPVPSLAEQRRIVGILDKFDLLVNDLSAGLPAELRARRLQYEYYREKLLSF